MATDICDYLTRQESPLPLWKEAAYDIDRAIGSLVLGRSIPKVAEPRLLNLGCGPLYYPGWMNADCGFIRLLRDRRFRPDWQLNATKSWKAPDNYFDGIFTQHVLEHFSYKHVIFVLDECFRTLKPSGWLRVSVPNIDNFINYTALDKYYPGSYLSRPEAISRVTRGGSHRSVWDPALMMEVMIERRFVNVRETEFGVGTDKRLAEKDQEVKRGESLYMEAQKPLI